MQKLGLWRGALRCGGGEKEDGKREKREVEVVVSSSSSAAFHPSPSPAQTWPANWYSGLTGSSSWLPESCVTVGSRTGLKLIRDENGGYG
ncbi:hypothetical protein ZIOFF_043062 [Zingiber officinale]|uniref:Uncharacterized protein n=1 Tax=Zingiber officinale TaxID=94328 RepID=A0A8J5G2T3_ZINOF|nr:hypothetical protein ZIOFF_043062 [Zingiber officinale]